MLITNTLSDFKESICQLINEYQKEDTVKSWLTNMGYAIDHIDFLEGVQTDLRIKREDFKRLNVEHEYDELMRYKKSDIQLRIIISPGSILKFENISLLYKDYHDKKVVDKRDVETYKSMWGFNNELELWLKLYTGKLNPMDFTDKIGISKFRHQNRLSFDEMPKNIQDSFIQFFNNNRIIIASDLLKGRGGLSANWVICLLENSNEKKTIFLDINKVMNHFGAGEISTTESGALTIGGLVMEASEDKNLQFLISPQKLDSIS